MARRMAREEGQGVVSKRSWQQRRVVSEGGREVWGRGRWQGQAEKEREGGRQKVCTEGIEGMTHAGGHW